MQQLDSATDSGALPFAFYTILGVLDAEMSGDIALTEPMERELAAHGCCAESVVICVEQIEGSAAFGSGMNGLAGTVEHTIGICGVIDYGKSVDVLLVGRDTDLSIPVQVGNTLGHGKPTGARFSVADSSTPDHKLMRIIDHGFNAQYDPEFVVHFHAVGLDPMFDSGALPPLLEISAGLAGEGAVKFTAKESHDVLGPDANSGMLLQILVQPTQGGAVDKEDVGGEFGLVGHPIVLIPLEDISHQGVDSSGIAVKDFRPFLLRELVGNGLRPLAILNADKGVFHFLILHPSAVELAREPFVPVEVDLDGKRHPGRDANMHEAQRRVHEIEVQSQTPGSTGDEVGLVVSVAQGEAFVFFTDGKHAYQSFRDAIALCYLVGKYFLTNIAGEVDIGSVELVGKRNRVLLYFFGAAFDELLGIFEQKSLVCNELFGSRWICERQVPLKDNAIKDRYHSCNLLTVLRDEIFHDALLRCDYLTTIISEDGRHFFTLPSTGGHHETAIGR